MLYQITSFLQEISHKFLFPYQEIVNLDQERKKQPKKEQKKEKKRKERFTSLENFENVEKDLKNIYFKNKIYPTQL